MEESKKAPKLQVLMWEDGVFVTREKDVRNTLTGVGRWRVWLCLKTDPTGGYRSDAELMLWKDTRKQGVESHRDELTSEGE